MMNKVLKTIAFVFSASFLCLSSGPAAAADYAVMELNLMPYFAFDGEMRHINFENAYGGNLFRKDYPETDFSVGLNFNCYFGIEAGYKFTATKVRNTVIVAGQSVLGQSPLDPPEQHASKAQYKGWHFGLNGYLPIYQEDCLYLFGSLGFSHLQLFQKNKTLTDGGGAVFAPGVQERTFKKNKTIPYIAGGVLVVLDDKTSLRFRLAWENTAQFKTLQAKEDSRYMLKPKNSFIYGAGIIIKFL